MIIKRRRKAGTLLLMTFGSVGTRNPETLFKEKHGVWDPMPELTIGNSPYLIVNSVVSYPSPLQRERGGVGKISLISLVLHLFLSANFQNNQ
jgi:hypothetical protein